MGVIDRRQTETRDESPQTAPRPSAPPGDAARLEGWLAAPATVILVVLCCAGPLLIGALAAAGAGAWLAGHGYAIGAAALLVMAAFLAWRIRVRLSRG